eukprot:scaffold23733_cov127-Cylindrotheca_fusiformis.AAC.2
MGGKRETEAGPQNTSEPEGEESGEETKGAKTHSQASNKKAKLDTSPEGIQKGGVEFVEKGVEQPQNPSVASEAQVRHEALSENALVIFGLHPLITKEEMKEVMSEYGKVERLETRKAFASTYCFCDYETAAQATDARKKLNGTSLKGKELIVKLAYDSKAKSKPFSR